MPLLAGVESLEVELENDGSTGQDSPVLVIAPVVPVVIVRRSASV